MEFLLLDFKLYDKILLPDNHSTIDLRSEGFLSFICKYRTWVSLEKVTKDFLNVNLLNTQSHERTQVLSSLQGWFLGSPMKPEGVIPSQVHFDEYAL